MSLCVRIDGFDARRRARNDFSHALRSLLYGKLSVLSVLCAAWPSSLRAAAR
jgi:hypothetical protein